MTLDQILQSSNNKLAGTISIKEVASVEELAQAQQIRVQVLEDEQGFPHDVNIDGLDSSAIHVLMLDDNVPVATARLTVSAERAGKIARIAVLPSHRGRGLGKRLIRRLESLARRKGLHALYVEPHAHLEPFFRRLGYNKVRGSVQLGEYNLIRVMKKM